MTADPQLITNVIPGNDLGVAKSFVKTRDVYFHANLLSEELLILEQKLQIDANILRNVIGPRDNLFSKELQQSIERLEVFIKSIGGKGASKVDETELQQRLNQLAKDTEKCHEEKANLIKQLKEAQERNKQNEMDVKGFRDKLNQLSKSEAEEHDEILGLNEEIKLLKAEIRKLRGVRFVEEEEEEEEDQTMTPTQRHNKRAIVEFLKRTPQLRGDVDLHSGSPTPTYGYYLKPKTPNSGILVHTTSEAVELFKEHGENFGKIFDSLFGKEHENPRTHWFKDQKTTMMDIDIFKKTFGSTLENPGYIKVSGVLVTLLNHIQNLNKNLFRYRLSEVKKFGVNFENPHGSVLLIDLNMVFTALSAVVNIQAARYNLVQFFYENEIANHFTDMITGIQDAIWRTLYLIYRICCVIMIEEPWSENGKTKMTFRINMWTNVVKNDIETKMTAFYIKYIPQPKK